MGLEIGKTLEEVEKELAIALEALAAVDLREAVGEEEVEKAKAIARKRSELVGRTAQIAIEDRDILCEQCEKVVSTEVHVYYRKYIERKTPFETYRVLDFQISLKPKEARNIFKDKGFDIRVSSRAEPIKLGYCPSCRIFARDKIMDKILGHEEM